MAPCGRFMQADIGRNSVRSGFILARIWTWAISIGHALLIKKVARENECFERDFWKAQDIDRFHEAHGREDWPSAKIFSAGIAEWRRSTRSKALDRDGTRARLATAMHGAVAAEIDRLSERLNIQIGRAHV